MGKVPICVSNVPSMDMPSFHQDSFAGGLLELESQMMVASMPGRSSSGSMRIFTVSGATAKETRIKNNARCCQTAGGKPPQPPLPSPVERCYLQCTLRVVDSKSGISVALLEASQRYCAWLSVTLANIVISAETDLSAARMTELICEYRAKRCRKKR